MEGTRGERRITRQTSPADARGAFGSHTPCYDEHGQELDYHDDVPAATDSQKAMSWGEYFRQQGCNTHACGLQIATSLDEEVRILQGPTMTSTASEEATCC